WWNTRSEIARGKLAKGFGTNVREGAIGEMLAHGEHAGQGHDFRIAFWTYFESAAVKFWGVVGGRAIGARAVPSRRGSRERRRLRIRGGSAVRVRFRRAGRFCRRRRRRDAREDRGRLAGPRLLDARNRGNRRRGRCRHRWRLCLWGCGEWCRG